MNSEDEPCKDCGEQHETLEEVLKMVKRRYRGMVCGYFASLATVAYGSYEVFGPFGPVIVAGLFGVYFFHLNMRLANQQRDQMEMFNKMEGNPEEILKKVGNGTHGQYL